MIDVEVDRELVRKGIQSRERMLQGLEHAARMASIVSKPEEAVVIERTLEDVQEASENFNRVMLDFPSDALAGERYEEARSRWSKGLRSLMSMTEPAGERLVVYDEETGVHPSRERLLDVKRDLDLGTVPMYMCLIKDEMIPSVREEWGPEEENEEPQEEVQEH